LRGIILLGRVRLLIVFQRLAAFFGALCLVLALIGADSKPSTAIVNDFPQNRFSCSFTTTATASTVVTGCAAPGAGLSRYITNIQIGGGVAVGATAPAIAQYGTGSSCGTGTTVVYRCYHAATAQCDTALLVPIKLGANSDLCILDAATGTKSINVTGYIAP